MKIYLVPDIHKNDNLLRQYLQEYAEKTNQCLNEFNQKRLENLEKQNDALREEIAELENKKLDVIIHSKYKVE